jgi:hypothetical protein
LAGPAAAAIQTAIQAAKIRAVLNFIGSPMVGPGFCPP